MDTSKRGKAPRKKGREDGAELTSEYVFFLDQEVEEAEKIGEEGRTRGLGKKGLRFLKEK